MDLVDLIESRRFLGGEFLTWLWYEQERSEGLFELPTPGQVRITFDDQLLLEAFVTQAEQSRFSGGDPCHSAEARTALRMGKRVGKAKLRLATQEREWVFTVNAGDFTFSSMKVPAVVTRMDEALLERLTLIDELSQIWLELYHRFLEVRLSDSWSRVEKELADWIRAEEQ